MAGIRHGCCIAYRLSGVQAWSFPPQVPLTSLQTNCFSIWGESLQERNHAERCEERFTGRSGAGIVFCRFLAGAGRRLLYVERRLLCDSPSRSSWMPLAARMLSGCDDARLSLRNMRGDVRRFAPTATVTTPVLSACAPCCTVPVMHCRCRAYCRTMLPLLVPDSEGAARAILLLESR